MWWVVDSIVGVVSIELPAMWMLGACSSNEVFPHSSTDSQCDVSQETIEAGLSIQIVNAGLSGTRGALHPCI